MMPSDDTIIELPFDSPQPVIALGAEMKSTVCLLVGRRARISSDHGHLSNPDAYRAFLATVERMLHACDPPASIVAHDMHPDYAATRYARQLRDVQLIPVQHHHAHIAAAAAEHGLTGPVVGLACDGTGYGSDGNVWGGEVLVAGAEGSFSRAGHLSVFPLPGGDAAAIDTWRPAAGIVQTAYGNDWPVHATALFHRVDRQALDLLRQRLSSPTARVVGTSSLGRLFDAVAFLLGLCDRNDSDAAAPIAVQAAAESAKASDNLSPSGIENCSPPGGAFSKILRIAPDKIREGWCNSENRGGAGAPPRTYPNDASRPLDTLSLVRAIIDGMTAGECPAALARGFHDAIAAMLAEAAIQTCNDTGTRNVVLSGGCFLNRLLTTRLTDRLAAAGLSVYTHEKLSPGDECVSLGQAVIAAQRLSQRTD